MRRVEEPGCMCRSLCASTVRVCILIHEKTRRATKVCNCFVAPRVSSWMRHHRSEHEIAHRQVGEGFAALNYSCVAGMYEQQRRTRDEIIIARHAQRVGS